MVRRSQQAWHFLSQVVLQQKLLVLMLTLISLDSL